MWIDTFCDFPFNRCRCTSEGWLSFCCFQRPDPLLPESNAYLGNVLEQTFDQIWFSDLAEEIRQKAREGGLHKKCQCPGCPFLSLPQPYPKRDVVYNEYPNFLEIDLPNTHCNIKPGCVMCERAAPHFRPEVNNLEEVLGRLKHVVPNLYQVHIQGIAEPFFQTRQDGFLLFDVMTWLGFDAYADYLTLSVTTNGTLLRDKVRKEYLQRAPHSITNFSIDAATSGTYKAIRLLDCFSQVLTNMYAFDKERVRERQFLRVCNNINTMNLHEVLPMCHIAQRARAEYVEFNATDGFNHKILVNEKNCGLFKKAQQDIIDECKKLGLPLNILRPLDLGLADQLALM